MGNLVKFFNFRSQLLAGFCLGLLLAVPSAPVSAIEAEEAYEQIYSEDGPISTFRRSHHRDRSHHERSHHERNNRRQGPTGPTGPIGPTGPDTFTPAIGQTVEFLLQAAVSGITTGNVVLTAFVSTPDGTVIKATPITVTSNSIAVPLPSIPINNPLFGSYLVGINVINNTPDPVTVTLDAASEALVNGSPSLLAPIANAIPAGGSAELISPFVFADFP